MYLVELTIDGLGFRAISSTLSNLRQANKMMGGLEFLKDPLNQSNGAFKYLQGVDRKVVHGAGGNARAKKYDDQKNIVHDMWGDGSKWGYKVSKCVKEISQKHGEIESSSATRWIELLREEQTQALRSKD